MPEDWIPVVSSDHQPEAMKRRTLMDDELAELRQQLNKKQGEIYDSVLKSMSMGLRCDPRRIFGEM